MPAETDSHFFMPIIFLCKSLYLSYNAKGRHEKLCCMYDSSTFSPMKLILTYC